MIILLVVILFVVGLAGYIFAIYNSLVRLKNDINKALGNIDVLLKQRYDELPKLINSVKGYMKHEKSLLTDITKARSIYSSAGNDIHKKAQADNMMTGALKTLFAVSENYPQLKANENFMQLQGRISGIENELADRREFYNDSVNTFNIRIQSIPDVIIARMLGYTAQEMFKAAGEEKKDVKVEF
ncbi:LemA family protein [Candidatus Woesearchaeota archaeon CG10_big_fil_rev_8_21_14_0_10_44_13]|nr:MAG: LemA family protein [Candidatus Woesearchaeota archaeon CG10_big_fil_rev_8_21_14_0_10_44_13]